MLSAPAINATSEKLASGFSAAHNHTTLVSDKNKTTMKMIPLNNPERFCAVFGAGCSVADVYWVVIDAHMVQKIALLEALPRLITRRLRRRSRCVATMTPMQQRTL